MNVSVPTFSFTKSEYPYRTVTAQPQLHNSQHHNRSNYVLFCYRFFICRFSVGSVICLLLSLVVVVSSFVGSPSLAVVSCGYCLLLLLLFVLGLLAAVCDCFCHLLVLLYLLVVCCLSLLLVVG